MARENPPSPDEQVRRSVARTIANLTVLAASIGVWLFYVQHQFERTHWAKAGAWDFHQAALEGSSYFHLPGVMRWFTANIGAHHVHHLCSRIPNYRLAECLKRYPELRQINRVTLWTSLKCLPLTLWDEEQRCLVSFRAARRRAAATAASTDGRSGRSS